MILLLRKLVFRFFYNIGLGNLLLYINRKKNKIPILVFHRVSPHSDPFWPPLTPEQFEAHIIFLKKKYSIITIDELFYKDAKELRRSCVITFDDAFRDFYEYAIPVINKHMVPVCMFVPVECVNNKEIVWTSQLDNCFKFTQETELSFYIGNEKYFFRLRNLKERIKMAFKVQKLLVNLPDFERMSMVDHIKYQLGYNNDPYKGIMDWEEICREEPYITYQSHTMTHPVLSKIKDRKLLVYQLRDSKNHLSAKLGKSVNYIAYPVGEHSKMTQEVAAEYYKAGFIVNNKLVKIKEIKDPSCRLKIPRFNINDSDPYELFLRINGFHKFFTE